MKQTVVVFGNDHTNTVGVTQSLGKVGYDVMNLLFGNHSGYVKASRYSKSIIWGKDENDCIEKLLKNGVTIISGPIPIVCCCDNAALAVNLRFSELVRKGYVSEYAIGALPFEQYFEKAFQVTLAGESGFNVPKSFVLKSIIDLPSGIPYPCLIKPLVSCKGAKSDIRVCRNLDELRQNLDSLKFTTQILLQQYVEKDYELCILGCAFKDGTVFIPCEERKISIFPKNVGLVSFADIQALKDQQIKQNVQRIVNSLGYVGLFSIELMHSKLDDKLYFTEINLRNDGGNSFIYKYGVNLPECHVRDLLGLPQKEYTKLHPGYYIWDYHHFQSMRAHDISLKTWMSEIFKSKGMLMLMIDDLKPFFKQYANFNPFRRIWKKIVK